MSLPAVKRLIGVGVALCLVAAIAAPVYASGSSERKECYKACKEQYKMDKKACYDAYKAAYALVKEQVTCCRQTACRTHNYPGMTVEQCLQDAKNKKKAAQAQKKACKDAAKARYDNCKYACKHPSPAAP